MRLYLLPLGQCDVDKGVVFTPGSGAGERLTIPVAAYLIETGDGQRILVDTGMHRKHITDPEATFRGKRFARYVAPRMRPEDDIVNRLGELGLTPERIDVVVSTHFHFDHAGNHGDFGGSRILAQREAHAFAKAHPGQFPRDLWDLPNLAYELFEGDWEIAPGITLLDSSGHVPGHTSVLVRLPTTGPVLLAIDAICLRENLETGNWRSCHDPERAGRSARRLAAIAEREGALLIFGHDPAQWSGLRLSPDFYD